MRHTWVVLAAVIAAAATLAPRGNAQQTLDARAGGFLAVDSTMRDLDRIWFAAGIDAHINLNFAKNSDTVFAVDVLTRDLGRSRSNIFPITLSEYFYFPYGVQRAYMGIGFGAFVADVQTNSKTVFGARGVIGMELTQDWFLEADYFLSDKFSGDTNAKANGLAVYLGYRF